MKLVGEGFVIAEPEGTATGTPQVGYTAVVGSGAPAATPPTAGTQTPPERRLPRTPKSLIPLSRGSDGSSACPVYEM